MIRVAAHGDNAAAGDVVPIHENKPARAMVVCELIQRQYGAAAQHHFADAIAFNHRIARDDFSHGEIVDIDNAVNGLHHYRLLMRAELELVAFASG